MVEAGRLLPKILYNDTVEVDASGENKEAHAENNRVSWLVPGADQNFNIGDGLTVVICRKRRVLEKSSVAAVA